MIIANPANASGNTAEETLNIVVGLADGTAAPGRIKVAVEDDGAGSTINAFPSKSASATLQGHPGAAGAAAVGAAFYLNTPACGHILGLEYFSSEGGAPILFDSAGNRLAAPLVRQKPDFVGPNGGNDTFLGFTLTPSQVVTNIAGCKNNTSFPNFFGTSAATPHVASIAALMLQANPALTPAQIYQALRASALPMDTVSPNFDSGYGFVQADAAFALIPQVAPAAPTLTLDKSSIVIGDSVTLTWSSVNTTSCTASGSWGGSLAVSGSTTVKPTAVGMQTYSLTCANSAGSSPATSVGLSVTAAPSKSGGGGGLDILLLAGLAGASMARILRFRRRVLI
jgi:subtilisin family serine protease